jgi:hypothetical protein
MKEEKHNIYSKSIFYFINTKDNGIEARMWNKCGIVNGVMANIIM